jgi:hypothetical protein
MLYGSMLISGDAYSFFGQVMEILSHINKRVKHRPEIPLPMLDLWNIYTGSRGRISGLPMDHLVSAKVVDSIRLVKIAQVNFYIPSPN